MKCEKSIEKSYMSTEERVAQSARIQSTLLSDLYDRVGIHTLCTSPSVHKYNCCEDNASVGSYRRGGFGEYTTPQRGCGWKGKIPMRKDRESKITSKDGVKIQTFLLSI